MRQNHPTSQNIYPAERNKSPVSGRTTCNEVKSFPWQKYPLILNSPVENQSTYLVRRKERRLVGWWFSQRQRNIAPVGRSVCKEAGPYFWHARQFYLVGRIVNQKQGHISTMPEDSAWLASCFSSGRKYFCHRWQLCLVSRSFFQRQSNRAWSLILLQFQLKFHFKTQKVVHLWHLL